MPEQKPNTGATTIPPTIESLTFLQGDMNMADAFSDLYSRMLEDARRRQDFVLLRGMQKLLLRQSKFMVAEYKKAGGRFAFEYHEGPEAKPKAETVQ